MFRVVAVTVLILLAACNWQVSRIRSRLAAGDADPALLESMKAELQRLPTVLDDGAYIGTPLSLSDRLVRMGGADVFAYMRYRDRGGHLFDLYLGGAIKNDENFHAPSYCMPAAGWEIQQQSTIPFDAGLAEGEEARLRRLVLQKSSDKMLVYFWFQAGSRVADHSWTIRYYRFLDLLASEPFRPTLIVTVYAHVKGSVAGTEEALQRFLDAIGPHIADITQGSQL